MSEPFIHPTAEVDAAAEISPSVMIWNWSKVCAGARIGEQTKIGQGVYVDRNVIIGKRCKIQNGVPVYTGVTLEDDVFVGPCVVFTNDRFPRAHSTDWHLISTRVERGASIGANATIRAGITLGRHCMIGAGAVVTRDVPPHALVVGRPGRIVDYVTISGQRLNWDVSAGFPPISFLEDKALVNDD
jgi:acetyltransferase-like isoleucine patch superfamily enzyme